MEQLKLSEQLIRDLQQVLVSVDERANDPFNMVQYLAAVIGYQIGRQNISTQQKQQLHQELSAFVKHVIDDIDQTLQRREHQATSGQAFGIWKPGDG